MLLTPMLRVAFCVLPLALPGLTGAAERDEAADHQPDLRAGEVMFRQCALCHGQHGQGILGGKYPRIGGMPEYYVMAALRDYQSGARGYDAMVVVGGLRVAQETDLMNLAAYVSDLDAAVAVDAPPGGDAANGKDLYGNDCKTCHGRIGEGKARKESPPLRSQYPEYLLRQIGLFKKREREHAGDPDDETFADYEDQELLDILAYIATFDDQPADAAGGGDADKEK